MKIITINPPDNYIMFVGWTIETIVAPSHFFLGICRRFPTNMPHAQACSGGIGNDCFSYEHATRPGVFWWSWE